MRYGIPYRGSKSRIAEWVVEHIPSAPCLVDLFAGGCAITHCALLDCRWDRIIANDLGAVVSLFCDAVEGKFSNEDRWITRKDFFDLAKHDDYVRLCWSFGNNGTDYLFSREREPWCNALWEARVHRNMDLLQEFGIQGDGSPADVRAHEAEYKELYVRWYLHKHPEIVENKQCLERLQSLQMLQSLPRLQCLEELRSLQTLQSLPGFQRLERLQSDYRDVSIPKDAVVYADPPYRGTRSAGYANETAFDFRAFDAWVADCGHPVLISEYTCPAECIEVDRTFVRGLMGPNQKKTERLFVHKSWYQWWRDNTPQGLLDFELADE